MESEQLKALVTEALEDVKATDIRILDVRDKTTITDVMIIATGNTNRQVKALINSVAEKCKQQGVVPLGTEGTEVGEWALLDLGDIVVHIMQPAIRDFYNIEKLWGDESPAMPKNESQ